MRKDVIVGKCFLVDYSPPPAPAASQFPLLLAPVGVHLGTCAEQTQTWQPPQQSLRQQGVSCAKCSAEILGPPELSNRDEAWV